MSDESTTDPAQTAAEAEDEVVQRINEDYLKENAQQELPSEAVKRLAGETEEEAEPKDDDD